LSNVAEQRNLDAARGGNTPPSDAELLQLAIALQGAALASGRTVSTAESCTGGLVGHVITQVDGSSDYYLGGAVSYSDALKRSILGVPAETLERHGAVSAQTAVAMADGARHAFGSDLAVSITGIAGPGGGTESKPVGLVYVCVASAGGNQVRRFHWSADRDGNKRHSAAAALELLLAAAGESAAAGAAGESAAAAESGTLAGEAAEAGESDTLAAE
jgi:nicotinamide-nucleotide amidase